MGVRRAAIEETWCCGALLGGDRLPHRASHLLVLDPRPIGGCGYHTPLGGKGSALQLVAQLQAAVEVLSPGQKGARELELSAVKKPSHAVVHPRDDFSRGSPVCASVRVGILNTMGGDKGESSVNQ